MARYNSYRSNYNRNYKPRSLRHREEKSQKKLIWNIILGVILIYIVFFVLLPALIGGLSNFHKSSSTQTTSATDNVALAPPVLNIPFEATSSASIQINGYASPNTKVEIYLDDNLAGTTTSDSDGNFQTDPINLSLGTNNISGKTVDDQGQQSLASKTIQVTYDNQKPSLTLSSPDENTQIHGGDKKVTVSGTTDPDNNISVNGNTVIVNNDGSFSTTVNINDGDNTITVTATNSVGNTTQIQRHVNYSES